MIKIIFFTIQIILCLSYLLFCKDWDRISVLFLTTTLSLGDLILIFKTNLPQTKPYYIRPIYIFTISFFIVHFQRYVDILVGKDILDTYGFYSNAITCSKTAVFSLLGIATLGLSYNYNLKRIYQNNYPKNERGNLKTSLIVSNNTYKYAVLFLVLFFVLFVNINGAQYLSGSYSQEMISNNSGTLKSYIPIIVDSLIVSCVILKSLYWATNSFKVSVTSYIRSYGLIFYIVLFTYWIFVAICGDRGPIIFSGMAIVTGILFTTKYQPRLLIVICFFLLAAFSISILGASRRNNGSEIKFASESISEYVTDINERETILPITSELAGSNNCALCAVNYCPDEIPHSFGLFSLNGVLSAIPFWGLVSSKLGFRSSINSSSDMIDLILNDNDKSKAGSGSSIIADLYFEGGAIGILIGMFLFGLLFACIDVNMFCRKWAQQSLLVIATSFVVLDKAIYIPRSMATSEVRQIFFVTIITYLLLKFTNTKNA